jgi:hypothetical protein
MRRCATLVVDGMPAMASFWSFPVNKTAQQRRNP